MNRPDLADLTLKQLKSQDEDNCLTTLCQCWLHLYRSGVTSTLDDLIIQLNQMSERYGGYSTKAYNILALALMEKQDFDRALKICENALIELGIETEAGEKHLTAGN
jgi:Coatomer epsilon subunit